MSGTPIADILGGRLARLGPGGRECFPSIPNITQMPLGEHALSAPEQTDKGFTISLSVRSSIAFYSFVIDHEIPFAYERPLRARSCRSPRGRMFSVGPLRSQFRIAFAAVADMAAVRQFGCDWFGCAGDPQSARSFTP
jgi:hypothetical protein